MADIQYFTLAQAKKEIKQRRKDSQLVAKVNEFLASFQVPPVAGLPERPFIAVYRQLATARFEDLEITRQALEHGLPVLWLEYLADIFTSTNEDKVVFWKLYLFSGRDHNNGPILDKVKLAPDINAWEGQPLNGIKLPSGESLVAFHHRLRYRVLPQAVAESCVDNSPVLKFLGRPKHYYPYFLALLIHRAILLEDFDHPKEVQFRQDIVVPAYQKVCQVLGVPPLIVRLPWQEHFAWYPKAVLEHINGAVS